MNIKRQVKLATIFALTSSNQFIKESQQAHIDQKDISISGLFSKISNLELPSSSLVAFDKRSEHEAEQSRQPENMEMLQIARSDSVKDFQLNGDEMKDVMDSFKSKKDNDASTDDSSSKQEDDQSNQQQSAAQSDQQSDYGSTDMTITEHMAQVKKQTQDAKDQLKKDQEEAAKKEKIEQKKEEERKKQEEERKKQEELQKKKDKPKDDKKQDEQEMDDFVEKQLSKQKQDREKYDRDILGTTTPSELVEHQSDVNDVKSNVDSIISQNKQKQDQSEKSEKESDEDSSKESSSDSKNFKNADEAMEHFGQSIAQRTVEGQFKKQIEKQEEDKKKIRAQNAKQQEKEKKIREENDKKEKEEQAKRDEEQRQEDDRKERLLGKLQSFGGNSEDAAPEPGFIKQAQSNKLSESESKQEGQQELDKAEEEQKKKKEEEDKSTVDPDEQMKQRLQQKLDSFQLLDDGTQSEPVPEEEKPKPVVKPILKQFTKQVKLKPAVDESLQIQKEIKLSFQSPIEEASKSQQFSSLVDQVEKEQQQKVAKAQADIIAKEEKEKLKSILEQKALEKELEQDKVKQMTQAQQTQDIAGLAQQSVFSLSALPTPSVVLPSLPVKQMPAMSSFSVMAPLPSFTPTPLALDMPSLALSGGATTDKKFDIHKLIQSAVYHNKGPSSVILQQDTPTPTVKPLLKPIHALAKKPVKPIVAPVVKAKHVVVPKPVIKPVVVPKVVKKQVVVVVPPAAPTVAPVYTPIIPAMPPTPPSVAHVELKSSDNGDKGDADNKADPLDEVSQQRLNAKWQNQLAENGVKAPSDITKALIDDSDADEETSGHGFFGKYLKKHRDMKKKAHDEIVKEDLELKARKERLKKEMSEKIKADSIVKQEGTIIPKIKKKKTLSERAHQKLIDEMNTKDAEAQEKAEMVVQVSQLAQLPKDGELDTILLQKSDKL